MDAEEITPAPPRAVRFPTMWQEWADAVFLHWEVDPDAVLPLLPQGVGVDQFAGRTYVGLVGLNIRVGPPGLPAIPRLGVFPEVNVRLYSVDSQGRRGIVFCSLDAARLAPVLAGRGGYRLPYAWADGTVDRDDDLVRYSLRRRWPTTDNPRTRFNCRIGDRIASPTPLEHFLTARWVLHWTWFGRRLWAAVEHEPWSLHSAELVDFDDELVRAAGLPGADDKPVSVLYSPGVTARIGPPTRLTRARMPRRDLGPGA